MKLRNLAAATGALMLVGSMASAAVLDFDAFQDPDIGAVDGDTLTFDGVDVTFGGTQCDSDEKAGFGAYLDSNPAQGGLGSFCDDDDNLNPDEYVSIGFDMDYVVSSLTLNGDHTDFGEGSIYINGAEYAVNGSVVDLGEGGLIGSFFKFTGISKDGYISGATVSAVPVPAAGFLLLGGLGGLAAMKRRKKKAA